MIFDIIYLSKAMRQTPSSDYATLTGGVALFSHAKFDELLNIN